MGVSLIVAFFLSYLNEVALEFVLLPAVVVGLGFIMYGQFKYNKGIF